MKIERDRSKFIIIIKWLWEYHSLWEAQNFSGLASFCPALYSNLYLELLAARTVIYFADARGSASGRASDFPRTLVLVARRIIQKIVS